MRLIFYTDRGDTLEFDNVTVRAEDDNQIIFTQPAGSALDPRPIIRQTSIIKSRFAGCTIDGVSIVPSAGVTGA